MKAPALTASLLALPLAVLLAGCTAGPAGQPPSTASGAAVAGSPTASAPSPSPRPATTPSPSRTPEIRTTYSPDDERIAEVIRAAVADAIPELKALNAMDPSTQVELFEPLGAWITEQKASLAPLTPSSCTAPAVESFDDGLAQYDDIRKRFLAWKDWGAHGRAYSLAAPGRISATLQEAVAELDATCHG